MQLDVRVLIFFKDYAWMRRWLDSKRYVYLCT